MKRIYFIWGEEQFMVDEEIKKVADTIKNATGEMPELVYIAADDLTPAQLRVQLEFSPLFSFERLVVIKKPSWIEKAKGKADKNQQICRVLNDYFSQSNEGQTLIITAVERNASNPIIRILEKEAVIINCKKPDSRYLQQWIKDQARAANCTITPGAVSSLARSGQDLYYLQNLIEKLSLMTDKLIINESDIKDELDVNQQVKIFRLTDALLSRDYEASLRALNELIIQGEHPLYFLYMIVRQFLDLGKVKHHYEIGLNYQEICQNTGIKEFRVRKLINCRNNFTWQELRHMFKSFLNADIKLKTSGQDEKIIIETLIIEICNK